ncbi:MAG: cob(I)yrinic acid a,c-diamide adenosyltransferase [Deltaproteobacteria bacterium]|nr:cob(I)yrinic acid a,c-diamide adenosyltransferase [Deltaproteobacteria bacterium]
MKKKKFPKGFIQVYTGNGKGKTTAALGLALRAAGHRFKVLIIQFLKGGIVYGELQSAKKLWPYLTIIPMGRENFVNKKNPDPIDVNMARKAWERAKRSIQSQKYHLVILDEINVAVEYGLVPLKELLALMKNKPENVELVLTGRWAKPEVLRRADLVTEMRGKKHYYKRGIESRIGIER